MKFRSFALFSFSLACTLPLARAGDPAATGVSGPPTPTSPSGDWCASLATLGTLYDHPDHPVLQRFHLGGRFQYQAAFLSGEDVNGREFNDTYDEYRRVRIESKTEFLRFFSATVGANLVADGRRGGGDLDWGYDSFDEAYLRVDLKEAFGAGSLDALTLGYGRYKLKMSREAHQSSKRILTIERSAISNKIYGSARPTGFELAAAKGPWSSILGVYSTEDDSEFVGGWNDGIAWYGHLNYRPGDALEFSADAIYNDREAAEDDVLGYEWAVSLDATYERDRFGMLGSLIGGENNSPAAARGGHFHGVVAMPWYWLVEEKLQLVFQYQYAGASEDEGIRTNSRYGRARHSPGVDVNGGRGDRLHTFYGGLNYYLCGHRAKIMGGVEYAALDTPRGDVDFTTCTIAFRGYF
jgi:hypothetical protein